MATLRDEGKSANEIAEALGVSRDKVITKLAAMAARQRTGGKTPEQVEEPPTTEPPDDEDILVAAPVPKLYVSDEAFDRMISGAEANEGAIKLARKYSFDKYGEGRYKVLTLINSFHGRTVTTLKATGQERFHNYFFPFTEGFDYAVANDIKSVRAKADDMTCAIMMELIQGEGGVLPLDREFVKEVEKLCREKDMLLIIDEVQTGIGRTGSLFAFQQYDIKPDVVTMAKGLGGGMPIGAVMAADTCCNVLTPGTHATTFGGTPIVCSAANVVLDTVGDGQFLMKVREKGEYLRNGILSLGSPNIKGVRGMGLMLGIIVEEGKHSVFANKLIENGVLAITAGKNAVRLLPPLTISKEEMDEALSIMAKVF